MTDDNLFAYARRSDPATARDAAASVDVSKQQEMILHYLDWKPGTTGEIAEYYDLPRDSISPRIRPLVDKGLVIDSGERRAGPSGRKAIVWKLKS